MSAQRMQLFDDASRIVQAQARFLGAERVPLASALNRILAEDVTADLDMPPFDKSAMDGYACRREDLDRELTVVETIPAGRPPARRIGRNECAKIMTGAVVPEGADCVIKVENTEQTGEATVRFDGSETPDNICRRGEDIGRGDIVLQRGRKLCAQQIAVLATVGCVRPLVARQPRVGIVPTGSELVEPDRKPRESQIRNSNGYQLCAQAAAADVISRRYGIAPDTGPDLEGVVKQAARENDVVLLSGGVSMGDFDLVPDVLTRNGVRLLFRKVAVKPGMPTVFGVSEEAFFFGLPGNPVSTFVLFELLVKPFLCKLMGHDFHPAVARMRLAKTVTRKKVARDSWLPVRCTGEGEVSAIEYHGSAHINALAWADGMICIPRGIRELRQGDLVDVRQI